MALQQLAGPVLSVSDYAQEQVIWRYFALAQADSLLSGIDEYGVEFFR